MLHRRYFLNENFIFFRCRLTETSCDSSKLPSGTLEGKGGNVLALNQRTGFITCWFNGERGYGFIHPEDGGEAVFVHHTGVAGNTKAKSLREGDGVSYEVANRGIGGRWAKNVCKAAGW
jgi:cold shock protein